MKPKKKEMKIFLVFLRQGDIAGDLQLYVPAEAHPFDIM